MTTTPITGAPQISDEDTQDLQETQRQRWDLIQQTIAGTIDPKVASAAGKLLDGVDRQVLTRQRIVVDSKTADSNVQIARDLIRTMRRDLQGEDIKRVENPNPNAKPSFTLPDDPAPDIQVVPGSTEVGVSTERFDEFTERMDRPAP